jgi:Aspartyl protease
MTGTLRRELIRAGALAYVARVLLPTVLANAAKAEGFADSRIISGSESVVPVSVEAGEVIVDVSINGRGPFPLMFDTGAEDAVTPEMAAALGLKTEGTGTARDSGGGSLLIAFTRVAAVRVGDAEMTDQPFAVLPLPRYLTDRGKQEAQAALVRRRRLRSTSALSSASSKPAQQFSLTKASVSLKSEARWPVNRDCSFLAAIIMPKTSGFWGPISVIIGAKKTVAI